VNKFPISGKYVWTKHAQAKMAYYRISPSRVRRIIKSSMRIEEGIAPNTIAFMQPVSYKTRNGVRSWNQEYWVMAVTAKPKRIKSKVLRTSVQTAGASAKIISAWRYPGMTKNGASLPEKILSEVSEALRSL
jgi:hypothetical protein